MEYCKDCGSALKGRIDKKFCNDHCRCNYNNMIHKNRNAELKHINAILRKNLVILGRFHENGISRLSIDMLITAGFNFGYFTHQLPGPGGEQYHCCYRFGYLQISDLEFSLKLLPL